MSLQIVDGVSSIYYLLVYCCSWRKAFQASATLRLLPNHETKLYTLQSKPMALGGEWAKNSFNAGRCFA